MTEAELQERLAYQEKAFALERRLLKRRAFVRGLVIGCVFLLILEGVLMAAAYSQREAIVKVLAKHFLAEYMEEFFAGFPDAYMTYNRDRVLLVLDNFTNAVAAHKVKKEVFNELLTKILQAISDRKVSYQEIDELLKIMELALNESNH